MIDRSGHSVGQLLEAMTLEEKAGQVMVIAFDGTDPGPGLAEMIAGHHFGGLIVYRDNVSTVEKLAELANAVQQTAVDSGHLPLILCIDQEGGWVSRLYEADGATELPTNMAVAATGDVENARRMAQVLGAEMQALGLNMNLAPVADVNVNPHNPIIGYRSFGDDPERVSAYVTAAVEAYQAMGILATAKHFPGHGDTTLDSHVAVPTVPHDRARLERVELAPFRTAIDAGVAAIMTSHVTFPAIDDRPGLPTTLSSRVLNGLLRGEMGFAGLIATDSLGMESLVAAGWTVPEAAVEALAAGVDLLVFGKGHQIHREAHRRIVSAAASGAIPRGRLDEAVRRVLLAKARYGVLDWQPVDVGAVAARVGTATNRAAAQELAAQAVTLVRDDSGLLPLSEDRAALVVETPGAAGLGAILEAQGRRTATRSLGPPGSRSKGIERLVAEGQEVGLVIVTTAAGAGAQGAGTAAALQAQDTAPIEALLEAGVPAVVVGVASPYDLLALPGVPAYVAAYGNNPPLLRAAASLLYGETRPRGRLPVELPGLYKRGDGLGGFVPR